MDFPGGRRLDLAKAGSIDVRPDETRSAKGNGSARAFLFSIVPRGVRGFDRRGVEAADKAAALSPRRAKATERQPLDPKPATCRQARSRWRPDDREVVRRLPRAMVATPRARRTSKRTPAGFPTALCGQSPKRVFSRRVLVSETSVVEADSKHLGDASKESREALRGAHRQATGRRGARNGAHRHSLRARVQWLAKAERPA